MHTAAALALPAITTEEPNPFQARASSPIALVLAADGHRHIVDELTPVVIDRFNPGASKQRNPMFQPARH